LDLAAVMDGGDGKLLDQIRDGERCGALVGAAGSGGAERAALPAGEPRDESLAGTCAI